MLTLFYLDQEAVENILMLLYLLRAQAAAEILTFNGKTLTQHLVQLHNELTVSMALVDVALTATLLRLVLCKASDVEIWESLVPVLGAMHETTERSGDTLVKRAETIDEWTRVTNDANDIREEPIGIRDRTTITAENHQTIDHEVQSGFQTPIRANTGTILNEATMHDEIDPRLKHELNDILYQDTPEFFNTFFGNTEWGTKANELLKKLEAVDPYNPLRWDESAETDEDKQKAIFTDIINPHLDGTSEQHHLFYGSGAFVMTDSSRGAKRKCDLFLHRALTRHGTRILDPPSSQRYSWKDILVPGELKRNTKQTETDEYIQLAGYVREVFGAQPTRRFVHAFLLRGTNMRCWVFHRAGGVGSKKLDILKEPLLFLTIVLAYSLMNQTELGLDPTIPRDEYGNLTVDVVDRNGKHQRLVLDETPLFHQPVIAGRATVCWRARKRESTIYEFVVKDSWRASERAPEGDLLERVYQEDGWTRGVSQHYAHTDIMVGSTTDSAINNVAKGLLMGTAVHFHDGKSFTTERSTLSRGQSTTDLLLRAAAELYLHDQPTRLTRSLGNPEDQRLTNPKLPWGAKPVDTTLNLPSDRTHSRTTVSNVGRPITKFHSIVELLSALRDCIKGHQYLHELQILHRDVSSNNLMITEGRKDNEPYGFLIDLDLAKDLRLNGPSGASHRTGTREFMALGLLQEVPATHNYRHDLESFFYVLLWICVNYDGTTGIKRTIERTKDPFYRWTSGDNITDAYPIKAMAMNLKRFKEQMLKGVSNYFDHAYIKTLLLQIRAHLFLPIGEDEQLHEGIRDRPNNCTLLYQEIIGSFDKAIDGAVRTPETTHLNLSTQQTEPERRRPRRHQPLAELVADHIPHNCGVNNGCVRA